MTIARLWVELLHAKPEDLTPVAKDLEMLFGSFGGRIVECEVKSSLDRHYAFVGIQDPASTAQEIIQQCSSGVTLASGIRIRVEPRWEDTQRAPRKTAPTSVGALKERIKGLQEVSGLFIPLVSYRLLSLAICLLTL